MISVEIVCVGDVDADVLDSVSAGLACELKAVVTLAGTLPVPPETYNADRRQYSSTEILKRLLGKKRAHGDPKGAAALSGKVLLAVTGVDLYAADLNFVFGEAHPAERACIVSLARLGTSREGKSVSKAILEERAIKEAVHEIGHLLGLGHCKDRACVMFFSNNIFDTDRKGQEFCKVCRRLFPSRLGG